MPVCSHLCTVFLLTFSSTAALPYVSQMPIAENTDYGIIEVTVSLGDDNPILGSGTPEFYTVQYRKEGEPWRNFETRGMPEHTQAGYKRKFIIQGLESGVVYNVRVVLADRRGHSYEGDLVPYYIVPTMCVLPEDYDYQVTTSNTRNSLIFSWNYTNANERWCPMLFYQVAWRENDQVQHTQDTVQSWFRLAGVEPDMKIHFRVRAVTTGGYAPFSKNVTFPATPSAPENLEVVNVTTSGAVLKWNHIGGVPKTFLINLQELEAGVRDHCCQEFSVIKMPIEKELPHYEIELAGLLPAAKYSVSVAVSTMVGEGASQSAVFTTPPPPMKVTLLPEVKVDTDYVWSWLPQELGNTIDNPLDYKHLIKHHLILVLPEDSAWVQHSGILVRQVGQLLENTIQKPFFVATRYNEGDIVALEDGSYGESDWGWYNNTDLPNGATYQLALAQLVEYGNALNVDVMYSTLFKLRD